MVRIGFAGVGYWGPNLLRNFAQFYEKAEVRAVCDKDKSKLANARRLVPSANFTTEFDDLLKDDSIDAVVLALPAHCHYEFARKVLEIGKDVFVEKPLAMSSRECEDLIDIANKKKRIVFVGHTFLYNAAVTEMKKYLDKGTIGDVYYVYSQRLNLGRVREDVDVMWNLAPHDISIISYLFDSKPKCVSARGFCYLRNDIADVAFITIEFENGISAHVHVSWLDPNKVRKMTLVGSKKMIIYDDTSEDSKIMIYDKGIDKKNISKDMGAFDNYSKFLFLHRSGDIHIPKINFEEPLKVLARSFIDCVEKRAEPVSGGDNGLQVVRILEAADRSIKNGGKVVTL